MIRVTILFLMLLGAPAIFAQSTQPVSEQNDKKEVLIVAQSVKACEVAQNYRHKDEFVMVRKKRKDGSVVIYWVKKSVANKRRKGL